MPLVFLFLVSGACIEGSPPPADAGPWADSGSSADSGAGDAGALNDAGASSDAGGSDAGPSDSGALDSGPGPDGGLPLGTVVESSTNCTGGAAAGATCMNLAVTCEGIVNTAEIALSQPANAGLLRGTITTHGGGSGTGYWGSGAQENFVTPYTQQNFRVVQIKWQHPWENNTLGLRRSGCFPATVYNWIYQNAHGADRSKGFCSQGSSGGSASIGYAMTQYGLAALFDYALLANGPAVADLAVGCDVQDYHGPVPDICPSIPNPVQALPASVINGAEQTTTCSCSGAGCASSADMQKWVADGVVSPTAVYDYPHTAVSFWLCGNNNTNGSTIGAFYFSALKAVPTNNVVANCWGGDAGPSSTCSVEMLFTDPVVLNAAISAMTDPVAGCRARH